MIELGLGFLAAVMGWSVLDPGSGRRWITALAASNGPLVAAGIIALVVISQWSVTVPAVGGVFVGGAAMLVRSETRRRTHVRRLHELPVVVDILARRIAAGFTVASALDSLTDEQRSIAGMAEVSAQIRSGQRVVEALSQQSGLVGTALLVTETTGGTTAIAMERLADRLSSSTLDGRAAQSQSGQQLASAAVMSLLPPLVSVLYGLSDDRAANFYLQSPLGAVVITASLLLSGAGWFWMRYITRPRPLR
ncbi:MAG: type II secretion system F family protein [Acidimicrobiales bacterium]